MRSDLGVQGSGSLINEQGLPTTERLRRALQTWKLVQRHCVAFLSNRAARRLRVEETISLGEKRFVSILHVDGQEFLLSGTASQVCLLARLNDISHGQRRSATSGESFSELFSIVSAAKLPESGQAELER